ncbi:MAG: Na/Pi symporter [Acidimicrobiia bacterium]
MDEKTTPPTAARLEVPTAGRAALVVILIYGFLIGVSVLQAGMGALGGDTQTQLLERVTNPLAAFSVGILVTVLMQSSSATSSVIVGLVASGTLSVEAAVPMIMGANIGTTITNAIVSLGHMRQGPEFRRAFATATVHDFFNLFAVILLFPLEMATGFLAKTATRISEILVGSSGSEWQSPIKTLVDGPVDLIETLFAKAVSGTAQGALLIVCGLVLVMISLTFITKNMRTLIADRLERSLNDLLTRGGGLVAMSFGLVITVVVQSSSITTSLLIPLAASGVLSIRAAYPVTLGANVGTTITALLAAMAASRPEALAIALVHTLFNLAGILLIYPLPLTRMLPVTAAEFLAEVATRRRTLALAWVVGTFVVVPLALLVVLG